MNESRETLTKSLLEENKSDLSCRVMFVPSNFLVFVLKNKSNLSCKVVNLMFIPSSCNSNEFSRIRLVIPDWSSYQILSIKKILIQLNQIWINRNACNYLICCCFILKTLFHHKAGAGIWSKLITQEKNDMVSW